MKTPIIIYSSGMAWKSGVLSAVFLLLAGISPLGVKTAAGKSGELKVVCQLSLEEEVEVASQEEGILDDMKVKEGDAVAPKQLLAQIDERIARMQLKVAENELAVAKEQAEDTVNERYARSESEVAKADLAKAKWANDRVKDAIPFVEMMRLEAKCKQMELTIEKALRDRRIAVLQYYVSFAKKDAADEILKHRTILSPTEGEIIKIYKHKGEWVQKGDRLVHLVRRNPLRAHGEVKLADFAPNEVIGRPVTFTVTWSDKPTDKPADKPLKTFTGVVSFIQPKVLEGKYLVRATIENSQENGQWLLYDGMSGVMTIHLK
jgi:multidrug efflux pump subunit AcrA (membrane-fusion protein)